MPLLKEIDPWEFTGRWTIRALFTYVGVLFVSPIALFLAFWIYFLIYEPGLGHNWQAIFGPKPNTPSGWATAALVCAFPYFCWLFIYATAILVIALPLGLTTFLFLWRLCRRCFKSVIPARKEATQSGNDPSS